jgi:DNA-binding transcriptional regulator YdaS (Cro superfamily)
MDMKFKWLCSLAAAAAFTVPIAASAQASNPVMPSLTPEQSTQVQQQVAAERRTMEARVGQGEVTPDEAERFLAWREWQIAQQVAGVAPPPSAAVQRQLDSPPPRYVYENPSPYYYGPAPYYYGPAPYYWGPTVCAGSWGRHGGGRLCF